MATADFFNADALARFPRAVGLTCVAVWCLSSFALAGAPAVHELSGARFFRDGEYERALVEFRVARELGASGEVQWYIAASLQKLGRSEEAVEAFQEAAAAAPAARDALLEYHWAMACSDAGLLTCATSLLAEVEKRAGPRIAQQARTVRDDIERVLTPEPPASAVDECMARAARAAAAQRPGLATAYREEAQRLSARRAAGSRPSDGGTR